MELSNTHPNQDRLVLSQDQGCFAKPSFRCFCTWPVFWLAVLAVVLVVLFKPWDEERQRRILASNWDDYVEMSERSFVSILSSERTFAYPYFLKTVRAVSPSLAALPLFYLALHIGAVFVFYFGLRGVSTPGWLAMAMASSLFFSTTLFDFGWIIMADAPAMSLGVATMGALLLVLGRPRSPLAWAGLTMSLFLTYQMRPAYLFLLGLVPLLGVVLAGLCWPRVGLGRLRRRLGLGLVAVSVLPYVGWCTLRLFLVGHFGLVSIGGYALLCVSGLWLTEPLVPELPEDVRPLALAALSDRPHAELWFRPGEKPDWSLVLDSKGRFDPSLVQDEERFNELMVASAWSYVRQAAKLYGNAAVDGSDWTGDKLWWIHPRWDWLQMESRLSKLGVELVRARPVYYLHWLQTTFRVGLVRALTLNDMLRYSALALGVMLFAWLCLAVLQLLAIAPAATTPEPATDYSVLLKMMAWIAVSFLLAALLQIILVAPPYHRYTSAVSVFLPSLVIAAIFTVGARIRISRRLRSVGRGPC